MSHKRIFQITLAMLMLVVLAGCGRGRNDATPTPTKTLSATGSVEVVTPVPPTGGVPAEQPAQQQPVVEQPTAATVVETIATVNTELLNIRAEPNTTAAIVDTAATGEVFVVLQQSADAQWLQLA